MFRSETVKVKLRDGSLTELRLAVSDHAPWIMAYQGLDGIQRRIEAPDLFAALQELSAELESAGCQLICAGARRDVSPSATSRGMGGGRKAYVLHLGKPGDMADMVDIFDAVEPAIAGPVKDQQAYYRDWIAPLKS